jgi:hypothetical protein
MKQARIIPNGHSAILPNKAKHINQWRTRNGKNRHHFLSN